MERGKARQGADPIVNQETNMSIRLFAAINDCSRMVVDGYEIEGSGDMYEDQLNLSYRVTDTYSHSVTDYCETVAWR